MNGTDLLREYRQTRSESAFAALVGRYTNLVYSVATRRLANASLAEEVVQAVFVRLAQAPLELKEEGQLVSWLHRTTVHVAIDVWRSETRRRTREQHALDMQTTPDQSNQLWDEVAPFLDEALDQLADPDRQALLLRFFDRKAMRDIGQMLGISEDAAKMRISRAVERLRSQLAVRGITCAAGALAVVLAERSLEAAPSALVAGLSALRVPASHIPAPIGVLGWLLLISKAKLAGGVAVLIVIAVGAVVLVRSLTSSAPANAAGERPVRLEARLIQSPSSQLASRSLRPAAVGSAAPIPDVMRLLFRVVDAETGDGLPNARIHMAYFYAGGRGEGHDLVTDQSGSVGIPEPLEPHDSGINVFVTAEGHVPKSMRFTADDPRREYTTRLDRGLSVGGIVVNDQGQPVPQVNIRVQGPGNRRGASENIDFQTSAVTTDMNGRWLCSFIPRDFERIRLILTRDGYAVTIPEVPAGQANPTNLVLVLDRGFTVMGKITDLPGHPIALAEVKELNNTGSRRQSTITDENGNFVLSGTGQFDSYTSRSPDVNANGTLTVRGLASSGEAYVDLTVQADGLAPELRRVRLLDRTNLANFVLGPGNIFRGRILDEAGDPLPNAVVRTDSDNHGLTRFQWSTNTDADGHFQWNAAPAEPTLFWFEAPGYPAQRDVLLTADGTEHEIRLKRK